MGVRAYLKYSACGAELLFVAWVWLMLLLGCVLGTHGVSLGSDPGPAVRKSHVLISRRVREWEAGHILQLVANLLSAEVLSHSPSAPSGFASRERDRRIVSEGQLSAAIKVLQANPLAPATLETIRVMQDLVPEGPHTPPIEAEGPLPSSGEGMRSLLRC